MQVSEDAQPNEHRLSNKGRNAVPAIRTARPVDRRIGWPANGGQTSSASAVRRQSRSFDHPGSSRTQPSHASGVGQSLPPRPDNFPPAPAPAPREAIAGSERPWKKRRIDCPPHNAHRDRARASDRGEPVEPGRQDTSSKLTITVPLPPECQSGAFRSTHRRRGWLKSKKRELEQSRGVIVLNHSFKGSDVLFDCKTVCPTEGPRLVCAPAGARQPPMPPPKVKHSLPEPADMNVKSETNMPSSSRTYAPMRRRDDHPDTKVCHEAHWSHSLAILNPSSP